jgi:hypothetical protein
MTDTQQTPRRSNGCLWGCLAILAFIFLPVMLAGGYGAWYLWQGFHRDPVMRTVTQMVNRDGLAHQVLGEDIRITGIEANAYSFMPGLGTRRGYAVTLAGSRAQGRLTVEAETRHGHVTIRSMILTGPHGGRYDLLRNVILTPGAGGTEYI